MIKSIFQKYVSLGYRAGDPENIKLKKASLLVVSGPFMIAGLIWGILYFSNGLLIPGMIPFGYGLLSLASIIQFSLTKKYKTFRDSQLFLILILPFALQLSLGGFIPSSAVIYWAIIAPAGAMFFSSIRSSLYWFGAYILLVIIAYVINGIIPDYVNWNLSNAFVNRLFLMNIIGVSSLVYAILYYFVGRITILNADIEKKKNELESQSEQLREMDKVKSRFFANISHEFRTPLTLILGLVNKQIQDPNQPPDLNDSLIMKRNSQRLFQLINQLLDISRLESKEMKIATSRHDIVQFVRRFVVQYEALFAGKGIGLTFNNLDIHDNNHSPIELYLDKEKLNKILTNLISNAAKFTPENGKVAVEVKKDNLTGSTIPEYTLIEISNTGDGIPKEKLDHIFDRFFQVDNASNRKYEGTGIGLALVKELVELHHGKVDVKSKLGVTTFTVRLPLDNSYLKENEKKEQELPVNEFEDIPLETHVVPSFETTESLEKEQKISEDDRLELLVVEDNPDLRTYISAMFQRKYHVILAENGQAGLKKAINQIPDLIISDVMMPEMDGYEFCRKLKENEKTNHIPLILLTAKASRENKLEGLEKGADEYLVKPFDEKELILKVKNLLNLRERLQKKYQGEIRYKPEAIKVDSVQQKFLKKIKTVIDQNLSNDLFGIDDLSKLLGMSRSQIHRKLKAITNQSATTFIRNYRIYRAADLLNQDSGSITEIAYEVGFGSQTYFSSSFSEVFGCSPSEYKRQVSISKD